MKKKKTTGKERFFTTSEERRGESISLSVWASRRKELDNTQNSHGEKRRISSPLKRGKERREERREGRPAPRAGCRRKEGCGEKTEAPKKGN